MTKLSRRDFLKAAATGAGALTLGAFLDACSQVLSPTSPATQPPSAASVAPTVPVWLCNGNGFTNGRCHRRNLLVRLPPSPTWSSRKAESRNRSSARPWLPWAG